jgi:hypothetical protein
VSEMDVDMAAIIAWCLMGAVMVGMVVTYGCMYGLVSQAYEEGRHDALGRVPTATAAVAQQGTPREAMPATSPHAATGSAA